jgi:hypothetical protein
MHVAAHAGQCFQLTAKRNQPGKWTEISKNADFRLRNQTDSTRATVQRLFNLRESAC